MLLRQTLAPCLAPDTYLIGCQKTGEARVIDLERDVQGYLAPATHNDLRFTAVAEPHLHADLVSEAPEWVADSRITTDLGSDADVPLAVTTEDFVFVGDVGRPDLLKSVAGQFGVIEPSARTLEKSLAERQAHLDDNLHIQPPHGAGSACGKVLGAVPTSTMGYEQDFDRPLRQAQTDAQAFVGEILCGQPEPRPRFATMKRANRDGICITEKLPRAPRLSTAPADALEALRSTEAVILWDCRDDHEAFAATHLPRSIYAHFCRSAFSVEARSYAAEDGQLLLLAAIQEDADLAVVQLHRIRLNHRAGWVPIEDGRALGLSTEASWRIPFDPFDPTWVGAGGWIFDLRTSAESQPGRLEPAVHILFKRLGLRSQKLLLDRKIWVHCGTGKGAAYAASNLRSPGYGIIHVDGVGEECERITQEQGLLH